MLFATGHRHAERDTHSSRRPPVRQAYQHHALILAVDGLQPLARNSQSHAAGPRVAWRRESGTVVSHLQMKLALIVSGGDSNFASRHQPGNSMLDGVVHQWLKQQVRNAGIESLGSDVDTHVEPFFEPYFFNFDIAIH